MTWPSTVLPILRPCTQFLFIYAAFVIAMTRVRDNFHHFSDVAAGALIGCVCGAIVTFLVSPLRWSRLGCRRCLTSKAVYNGNLSMSGAVDDCDNLSGSSDASALCDGLVPTGSAPLTPPSECEAAPALSGEGAFDQTCISSALLQKRQAHYQQPRFGTELTDVGIDGRSEGARGGMAATHGASTMEMNRFRTGPSASLHSGRPGLPLRPSLSAATGQMHVPSSTPMAPAGGTFSVRAVVHAESDDKVTSSICGPAGGGTPGKGGLSMF